MYAHQWRRREQASLLGADFIVHRYEQIEPDIVYGLAKHKLGRFRDFIDEIRRACAGETLRQGETKSAES
jgi:hypothetical protein